MNYIKIISFTFTILFTSQLLALPNSTNDYYLTCSDKYKTLASEINLGVGDLNCNQKRNPDFCKCIGVISSLAKIDDKQIDEFKNQLLQYEMLNRSRMKLIQLGREVQILNSLGIKELPETYKSCDLTDYESKLPTEQFLDDYIKGFNLTSPTPTIAVPETNLKITKALSAKGYDTEKIASINSEFNNQNKGLFKELVLELLRPDQNLPKPKIFRRLRRNRVSFIRALSHNSNLDTETNTVALVESLFKSSEHLQSVLSELAERDDYKYSTLISSIKGNDQGNKLISTYQAMISSFASRKPKQFRKLIEDLNDPKTAKDAMENLESFLNHYIADENGYDRHLQKQLKKDCRNLQLDLVDIQKSMDSGSILANSSAQIELISKIDGSDDGNIKDYLEKYQNNLKNTDINHFAKDTELSLILSDAYYCKAIKTSSKRNSKKTIAQVETIPAPSINHYLPSAIPMNVASDELEEDIFTYHQIKVDLQTIDDRKSRLYRENNIREGELLELTSEINTIKEEEPNSPELESLESEFESKLLTHTERLKLYEDLEAQYSQLSQDFAKHQDEATKRHGNDFTKTAYILNDMESSTAMPMPFVLEHGKIIENPNYFENVATYNRTNRERLATETGTVMLSERMKHDGTLDDNIDTLKERTINSAIQSQVVDTIYNNHYTRNSISADLILSKKRTTADSYEGSKISSKDSDNNSDLNIINDSFEVNKEDLGKLSDKPIQKVIEEKQTALKKWEDDEKSAEKLSTTEALNPYDKALDDLATPLATSATQGINAMGPSDLAKERIMEIQREREEQRKKLQEEAQALKAEQEKLLEASGKYKDSLQSPLTSIAEGNLNSDYQSLLMEIQKLREQNTLLAKQVKDIQDENLDPEVPSKVSPTTKVTNSSSNVETKSIGSDTKKLNQFKNLNSDSTGSTSRSPASINRNAPVSSINNETSGLLSAQNGPSSGPQAQLPSNSSAKDLRNRAINSFPRRLDHNPLIEESEKDGASDLSLIENKRGEQGLPIYQASSDPLNGGQGFRDFLDLVGGENELTLKSFNDIRSKPEKFSELGVDPSRPLLVKTPGGHIVMRPVFVDNQIDGFQFVKEINPTSVIERIKASSSELEQKQRRLVLYAKLKGLLDTSNLKQN